jgi:hypothetical protein
MFVAFYYQFKNLNNGLIREASALWGTGYETLWKLSWPILKLRWFVIPVKARLKMNI